MSSVLSRRSFLTGLSLAGVSALAACAQVPKELGAEPSLAPLAPGLQPQPAVAEPVAIVEPAANASDKISRPMVLRIASPCAGPRSGYCAICSRR